jgi:hypothetical protein
MTVRNAADLKSEFARISDQWRQYSHHRKCVSVARLDEIEDHLQDLDGQDELIGSVRRLRREIKFALSAASQSPGGGDQL